MRLIGRDVLHEAGRRHSDARPWLAAWATTVEDASWGSLAEVRRDYPSADGVRLASRTVVTVFNVRGNEYRLLTVIPYAVATVIVLEVLTHGEYDKQKWKRRH